MISSYMGAATNTANMKPTAGLPELINGLHRHGTPVILLSFSNPYLAMGLPRTEAHLIAWSPWTLSQRAAASAILGQQAITGKLPISIPGLAVYGDGLTRAKK